MENVKEMLLFFIAKQHANACRTRYCYDKSVRLSVCPSHSRKECTYRQTLSAIWYRGMTLVFERYHRYKIEGELAQRGR